MGVAVVPVAGEDPGPVRVDDLAGLRVLDGFRLTERRELQLPYTPDPGDDPAHQEEHHRYLALRKVRHTILRLIGDHYRVPQGAHRSWQSCNLDFTGVTIDGDLNFNGAEFSGGRMSFNGATFSGDRVSFDNATGAVPSLQ
ncbi:pentapeptide repeat-containing protein [Streptomyces sp. NPDC051207]|uniref:pentapeptide repeat-containing protein n=1 Tax=Streptomyces sp. NPDC051207 TaxID=3154641 RepID=UPI003447A060